MSRKRTLGDDSSTDNSEPIYFPSNQPIKFVDGKLQSVNENIKSTNFINRKSLGVVATTHSTKRKNIITSDEIVVPDTIYEIDPTKSYLTLYMADDGKWHLARLINTVPQDVTWAICINHKLVRETNNILFLSASSFGLDESTDTLYFNIQPDIDEFVVDFCNGINALFT